MSYDDYLSHHGIRGQKWGKRNGPPYPLNPEDHSAKEKKLNSNLKSSSKEKTKVGSKLKTKIKVGFAFGKAAELQNKAKETMDSIKNSVSSVANKVNSMLDSVSRNDSDSSSKKLKMSYAELDYLTDKLNEDVGIFGKDEFFVRPKAEEYAEDFINDKIKNKEVPKMSEEEFNSYKNFITKKIISEYNVKKTLEKMENNFDDD